MVRKGRRREICDPCGSTETQAGEYHSLPSRPCPPVAIDDGSICRRPPGLRRGTDALASAITPKQIDDEIDNLRKQLHTTSFSSSYFSQHVPNVRMSAVAPDSLSNAVSPQLGEI